MAVLPESQRRGIGSRLVEAGLRECRGIGAGLVFVLGHPDFYPRFGLRPAGLFGLHWEQEAPDEVFLVKELGEGSLEGARGCVKFRPEFNTLT